MLNYVLANENRLVVSFWIFFNNSATTAKPKQPHQKFYWFRLMQGYLTKIKLDNLLFYLKYLEFKSLIKQFNPLKIWNSKPDPGDGCSWKYIMWVVQKF